MAADTEALNKLLDKVQRLFDPAEYVAMLFRVGGKVGTLAENYARVVPPIPNGRPLSLYYTLNGKPSKFKTEKQRKFFFWALRTGAIKVPYVRSGKLVNSITHTVTLQDKGVIIRVGTNDTNNGKGKAKFVIGEPNVQNHYHQQTGWMNLASELKRHDAEYMSLAINEIDAIVRNGFR